MAVWGIYVALQQDICRGQDVIYVNFEDHEDIDEQHMKDDRLVPDISESGKAGQS